MTMDTASAPTPAPTEPPKPANPEPLHETESSDPEKGRVKTPDPGKPEHPKQQAAQRGDEPLP